MHSKNYSSLILVPKGKSTIILHEDLTLIESKSFEYNKNIKKIIIPENVKIIESSAFYSCSNLEEIIFGNKLKEIGNKAFDGTHLSKIFYDGIDEPNCNGFISNFEIKRNETIVYVLPHYKHSSFCELSVQYISENDFQSKKEQIKSFENKDNSDKNDENNNYFGDL